jgi:hypothetical protein
MAQGGAAAGMKRSRALVRAAFAATVAAIAPIAPVFAQQQGPGSSLTITPQLRESRPAPLSDADRRALQSFSGQPGLTAARGLSIGPAYGPQDQDCVRAGAEVFCRQ